MFLYSAQKLNPEKPNIFGACVAYAVLAYGLYSFNQMHALLALGVVAMYDINSYVTQKNKPVTLNEVVSGIAPAKPTDIDDIAEYVAPPISPVPVKEAPVSCATPSVSSKALSTISAR
jgi:hypothetical protein